MTRGQAGGASAQAPGLRVGLAIYISGNAVVGLAESELVSRDPFRPLPPSLPIHCATRQCGRARRAVQFRAAVSSAQDIVISRCLGI